MDYDDFEKLEKERRRQRFARFNRLFDDAMRKCGDGRTLDEVLGNKPKSQEDASQSVFDDPRFRSALVELTEGTTDDLDGVLLRAVMVWRSIVRHTQGGGRIVFVDREGHERTLKVRLKETEPK